MGSSFNMRDFLQIWGILVAEGSQVISSTNQLIHAISSTDHLIHRPSRPQTKSSTDQLLHRPSHPQTNSKFGTLLVAEGQSKSTVDRIASAEFRRQFACIHVRTLNLRGEVNLCKDAFVNSHSGRWRLRPIFL